MWIRLLIVLAGIVLMINGCNSLISQQFGTHKLRNTSVAAVVKDGLKDADYIELQQGHLLPEYIVGPALRASDEDYHLHPILTEEQLKSYEAGATVKASIIGWYKLPYQDCVKNDDCFPTNNPPLIGLVTEPSDKKNPIDQWAEKRINLAADVIYLQLWKEPLAWYWNLLMFLGGIGIAVAMELLRKKKE